MACASGFVEGCVPPAKPYSTNFQTAAFHLNAGAMRSDQFVQDGLHIDFRQEVILHVSRNLWRKNPVGPTGLGGPFPPLRVVPILYRPTKGIPILATDLQSTVIGKPEEKAPQRFLQRVKVFVPAAISHAVMVLPNLFDDDLESFGRAGKHANRIFSLLILRQGALL